MLNNLLIELVDTLTRIWEFIGPVVLWTVIFLVLFWVGGLTLVW